MSWELPILLILISFLQNENYIQLGNCGETKHLENNNL